MEESGPAFEKKQKKQWREHVIYKRFEVQKYRSIAFAIKEMEFEQRARLIRSNICDVSLRTRCRRPQM